MPEEKEERNREIIKLYRSGFGLREIGRRFGITAQRVWGILRRSGEPRRRIGRPESARWRREYATPAILALREDGKTVLEIAETVLLDVRDVRIVLRENGTPITRQYKTTRIRTTDVKVECRCGKCLEWLPEDRFNWYKEKPHGYCKSCAVRASTEYQERNRK